MRYIFAIMLFLTSSFAFATPAAGDDEDLTYIGKIENKGGGEIVLLASQNRSLCKAKGRYLDVIAYNDKGESLEGCWTHLRDLMLVKIEWDDGTVRVYSIDVVTMHPTIQSRLEANVRRQGL